MTTEIINETIQELDKKDGKEFSLCLIYTIWVITHYFHLPVSHPMAWLEASINKRQGTLGIYLKMGFSISEMNIYNFDSKYKGYFSLINYLKAVSIYQNLE